MDGGAGTDKETYGKQRNSVDDGETFSDEDFEGSADYGEYDEEDYNDDGSDDDGNNIYDDIRKSQMRGLVLVMATCFI